MNEVAIVSGMTKGRVIGRGNELPWSIKEDLQNFKNLTSGHTVIMGLNTFKSIGRPLPNRHNIVLSRENVELEGADVCLSIPEALALAKKNNNKTFIIGGASVYEQFLPEVNTMYLSFIKKDYDGDVLFPEYDEAEWERKSEEDFTDFTFVTLKRKAT